MGKTTYLLVLLLLCGSLFPTLWSGMAAAAIEETSLLAVDMGAESIKATTVDLLYTSDYPPGVSVNILLNDHAKRKTPPCIGFRYKWLPSGAANTKQGVAGRIRELTFAEAAQALVPRFPSRVVCAPTWLLGQTNLQLSRSQYYVEPDSKRCSGRLVVAIPEEKHPGKGRVEYYTAEELAGMLFAHLRETVLARDVEREPRMGAPSPPPSASLLSSSFSGEAHDVVRHAAVAILGGATVVERQAMIDAAAVGGLRVVRLAHSLTAAAVALGLQRQELYFPTPTTVSYVMLYDMGSRHTEAAVFRLASKKREGAAASNVWVPHIQLLSIAVNPQLGGDDFDYCIAAYWDRHFLNGSVLAQPPAAPADEDAARKRHVALLRAAKATREKLSVNREVPVVAEGVGVSAVAATPFTTTLSRAFFEDICEPLFVAAVKVRDDALAAAERAGELNFSTAGSTPSQLPRLEVIGGATRMPKLLEVLGKGHGNGFVGHTLNGDEAVAVGTAHLGTISINSAAQRVIVEERLTNAIGVVLTRRAGHPTGPSCEVEVVPVFAANRTPLPALRSVVLNYSDYTGREGLVVSLVSPLEKIQEVFQQALHAGSKSNVGERVCAAEHFIKHYHLQQLHSGLQELTAKYSVLHVDLVLEVAVSVSGVPYLRKAYARVRLAKNDAAHAAAEATITTIATAGVVNLTSNSTDEELTSPGETTAGASDKQYLIVGEGANTSLGNTDVKPAEAERAVKSSKNIVRVVELSVTPLPRAPTIAPDDGNDNDTKAKEAVGTAKESGEGDTWCLQRLPRGANLLPDEVVASRRLLKEMQAESAHQKECSFLRNAIESNLVALRTTDAWLCADEEGVEKSSSAFCTEATAQLCKGLSLSQKDDVRHWRRTVGELDNWLDVNGEHASLEELKQQQQRSETLRKVILHLTSPSHEA